MPIEILVVDDDKATRQWLCSVLDAEGYACHVARNTQEAEDFLHRTEVQLALVDIYLGQANGVEFLRRIKAIRPDCDCVMMTAHASVETMARSVKDGAVEYLGKPLRIDDLLGLVRRLESRRQSRSNGQAVAGELEPEGFVGTAIIGRSPKMLEVYRSIARVAPTDATVLIVGPSGSGKE
ncbi:MAG: response regulator, partial [Candidatus Sulfotelmatobacter sp.]